MTDPKDISYPEKSDARGSAKKYHKRRAYYFGRHNTPESYSLFAIWKQRLIETGEAPPVSEVKEILGRQEAAAEQSDEFQQQLERRARELDRRAVQIERQAEALERQSEALRMERNELEAREQQLLQRISRVEPAATAKAAPATAIWATAVCLLLASILWIGSSPPAPTVDGLPLTESETNQIRGARMHATTLESIKSNPDRHRALEARRERLKKLGAKEWQQETSAKPLSASDSASHLELSRRLAGGQ